MKNLKKLLLLLLLIPISFSCDKDDEDSSPVVSEPTNFYEAHNGVWVVTIENLGGVQVLLDVDDTGWDSYGRESNSGCWSVSNSAGGSTTITSNTPDELLLETVNIPISSVFGADDTQILLDAGYTSLSVDAAYLHTSDVIISFAEILYAGNFEVELLDLVGNLGKQSSDSYSICKNNSTKIYELTDEAIEILTNLSSSK